MNQRVLITGASTIEKAAERFSKRSCTNTTVDSP